MTLEIEHCDVIKMGKLWLCLKLLLAPFLPEEAFFSAAPFTFSKKEPSLKEGEEAQII